jgi:hypothetical protein
MHPTQGTRWTACSLRIVGLARDPIPPNCKMDLDKHYREWLDGMEESRAQMLSEAEKADKDPGDLLCAHMTGVIVVSGIRSLLLDFFPREADDA